MTGRPAGVSQKAWTFLKAEGMTQGLAADVLCTWMEKNGEEWRRMEKSGEELLYNIRCSVFSVWRDSHVLVQRNDQFHRLRCIMTP